MTDAALQALLSILRALVVIIGYRMVARGDLNSNDVEQIVGVVTVGVPVLWGAWQKFSAERKTKVREAVAVNVGIAVADMTMGTTPAVPAAEVPALIAAVAPVILTAK